MNEDIDKVTITSIELEGKQNISEETKICLQCDPPGSGKECRGGPCHTCKGEGKIPISR